MKDTKTKNNLSTIWLDFINYIFMPFYILTVSLNLIDCLKSISTINIIKSVIFGLCIMYSFFTFYQLIKRMKKSYYCLLIFLLISISTIIYDIINKYNLDNSIIVILVCVIGVIFWLVPNYIYVIKRKKMFREHQLLNIKKCPGCSRIIPVSMTSCGRCNYKEVEESGNN